MYSKQSNCFLARHRGKIANYRILSNLGAYFSTSRQGAYFRDWAYTRENTVLKSKSIPFCLRFRSLFTAFERFARLEGLQKRLKSSIDA